MSMMAWKALIIAELDLSDTQAVKMGQFIHSPAMVADDGYESDRRLVEADSRRPDHFATESTKSVQMV